MASADEKIAALQTQVAGFTEELRIVRELNAELTARLSGRDAELAGLRGELERTREALAAAPIPEA